MKANARSRWPARHDITRDDGSPYLVRWRLLSTPFGRVYLHRFLAPDAQCPHDHPWPFLSLILWGGYWEQRFGRDAAGRPRLDDPSSAWRGLFSLACRRAEDVHRIARLHPTRPTWTLVVTARRQRRWGFWTSVGWTHYRLFDDREVCE